MNEYLFFFSMIIGKEKLFVFFCHKFEVIELCRDNNYVIDRCPKEEAVRTVGSIVKTKKKRRRISPSKARRAERLCFSFQRTRIYSLVVVETIGRSFSVVFSGSETFNEIEIFSETKSFKRVFFSFSLLTFVGEMSEPSRRDGE